jgi:hypothetical protein
MSSAVDPGGCTAPEVRPSVSAMGRRCFEGGGSTTTSISAVAGGARRVVGVGVGGVGGDFWGCSCICGSSTRC